MSRQLSICLLSLQLWHFGKKIFDDRPIIEIQIKIGNDRIETNKIQFRRFNLFCYFRTLLKLQYETEFMEWMLFSVLDYSYSLDSEHIKKN